MATASAYNGPTLAQIMGMPKQTGQSAISNYLAYYQSHPELDPGFTTIGQFHGDPFVDEKAAQAVLNARDNYTRSIPPAVTTTPLPPPVAPPSTATITPDQLAAAQASARSDILGMVGERGLDPNQYNIGTLLDRELKNSNITDPKGFTGSLEGNILDRVLSQAQDNQRGQYTNLVDQQIGQNYGNKQISSGLLDDTISGILGQQRATAQTTLDRGLARGIYNDVGYNAGLSTLGNEETAARARLNSMGNDVLSGYRTKEDAVRDSAYGAANSYTLGRNFNINDYLDQGSQIATGATKNASGDLLNTLGGTQLFDTGQLSNNIGQAQGAVNLRDSDVATALAERKRRNTVGRGLGSQGVF